MILLQMFSHIIEMQKKDLVNTYIQIPMVVTNLLFLQNVDV